MSSLLIYASTPAGSGKTYQAAGLAKRWAKQGYIAPIHLTNKRAGDQTLLLFALARSLHGHPLKPIVF